jgi:hypothetical protein
MLLAVLLSGCAADPTAYANKGYSVTGKDPFRFEVDPQLLREWGGPGSAKFNQVLDQELERQQICRNGYSLRNEHLRDGVFSVSGRCKS